MTTFIFVVVWATLILRLPAVRNPRQRPAWIVLVPLGVGAAVVMLLQSQRATRFNAAIGLAQGNELIVGLVAAIDFAAVWWFALFLQSNDHPVKRWKYWAPVYAAATMSALTIVFFALTPAHDRFAEHARHWWIGYAVAWSTYGTITVVNAAVLFLRSTCTVRNPSLRISFLALTIGTGAEVPYLLLRAIRWFTPQDHPLLIHVASACSDMRFVLVALGCSSAALQQLGASIVYWYQRQRLYRLWASLRAATPELVLTPPRSRSSDLITFRNSWAELHQRIIEMQDCISALRSGWATTELIHRATNYAASVAPSVDDQLTATACWVATATRSATAGHPRLDDQTLPEAPDVNELLQVRYLIRLSHTVQSRAVKSFVVDTVPQLQGLHTAESTHELSN